MNLFEVNIHKFCHCPSLYFPPAWNRKRVPVPANHAAIPPALTRYMNSDGVKSETKLDYCSRSDGHLIKRRLGAIKGAEMKRGKHWQLKHCVVTDSNQRDKEWITVICKRLCLQCKCSSSAITTVQETLTLSMPDVPNCCYLKGSASYWSNPPFLIFDIRALWRSVLSARVPECQKLKLVG